MIRPFRSMFLFGLACLTGFAMAFGLLGARQAEEIRWAAPSHKNADRAVFLIGNLSDEDRIILTSALAGSGHPGVVLFDAEQSRQANRVFLEAFQPARIIRVTRVGDLGPQVEQLVSAPVSQVSVSMLHQASGFWRALYPQSEQLVIAPAQPRRLLLQAACLAGVLHAPLFVCHDRTSDATRLADWLAKWHIKKIHAVGDTGRWCESRTRAPIHKLADEENVQAAYVSACRNRGRLRTLVLANPADVEEGSKMSLLAPWLALQKHGLMLLTNTEGNDVEKRVEAAVRLPGIEQADKLILLADLQAIPMRRRPNPLPGGKDEYIEMEPMTPEGDAPHSFAVGRLFHADVNVVALMLARARLLTHPPANNPHGPIGNRLPRALIASNPGGGLPLLESFSRSTAREFANAGYDTTALFEGQVNPEQLRQLLPQQTIFLWEGHYATLVRNYKVHQWSEPLRPSLVFLQSCLALSEDKALPFLLRGACAVIGTSTRTYSASGGALALAYFDALLYERQSVGAALRHAKNFLQVFAQLKEKRLGAESKMGGANIRTAWAFTLWGDPTLQLPTPRQPPTTLPRVRHEVQGNLIRISVPELAHEKASVGRYETEIWANARLGGLLRTRDPATKQLVPLVFTEVSLPQVPPERTPVLSTRLPGKNWVFSWDERRRYGYILATPRPQDAELCFHLSWN